MTEEASVDRVEEVKSKALGELGSLESLEQLEEGRIAYMGRRGQPTQSLRGVGSPSPD